MCYRQAMNENTIRTSPVDVAIYLDSPDVLSAGKLCLEFANTADWHASGHPVENIYSYQNLVEWAVRIGIRSPEAAEEFELREAIYAIFVAIAKQSAPAPSDLAILNEALPHAFTLPEIVPVGAGYGWRWRGDESGLDGILWPIVRSAARLLTDGEHSRIGQCADDRGCGYLFYDTSRNRSRRWCDMSSCGNRAKSQRHYARHRTATDHQGAIAPDRA
jgi:predicted RNA-binding Zn ribbon-like protein